MAELMARQGNRVATLKKGQEVTGTITTLTSQEIMLQLDSKTDVLVFEKDKRLHKQLITLLTVGDKVTGSVLYPESDAGYPVVTLRPFMEKKVWESLEKLQKSGEKVSVTVTDSTKGGLVVETESGMSGFLPNSHMVGNQKMDEMVGVKLQVSVAELHKDTKKIVFSQKENLTADDFTKLSKQYPAGTKITGKVSGVTTFGLFVSLPYKKSSEQEVTVDGLVHVSEISWEKTEDIAAEFSKGQMVEAVVIGVDPRSRRIDLSIKRLSGDPFQKIGEAFPIEKKVSGLVGDTTELGLLIDLGEIDGVKVEGLVKKDKIPAATTYEKGQKIQATVVAIDSRKRKIMLTPVLLEKPLMYR